MQPSSEIRFHAVDLKEFGTTPFGASEYRVVWADSRIIKAYRGDAVLTTARYRHGAEAELRGKWILERWLPAGVYYGMDAEAWDKLQKTAVEQTQLTTAQDREIDRFLSTLPREQRAQVESMHFSKPASIPITEPYSHDGEYEFAGLYFKDHVDDGYLKSQVRAHLWRLANMNASDRKVEFDAKDAAKDAANEDNFEAIWQEGRELSLTAK